MFYVTQLFRIFFVKLSALFGNINFINLTVDIILIKF